MASKSPNNANGAPYKAERNRAFGEVLRIRRTEQSWSQEELAERCDLDRTYISLLENGKRGATLNTIFSLSKAFGCEPTELVEETMKCLVASKKASNK